MIIKILISIFISSIELLTMYNVSFKFKEVDCENKTVRNIAILLYLGSSIVYTIVGFSITILILLNFCLMLAYTYAFQIKFSRRCVAVGFYTILSISFELFAVSILTWFVDIRPDDIMRVPEAFLIAGIIGKFLLYVVAKMTLNAISPSGLELSFVQSVYHYILSFLSLVMLIILAYIAHESKASILRLLVLITSAIIVSNNIFTYIMYEHSVLRDAKLMSEKKKSENYRKEKEEYNALIEGWKKSNKEIHDIKHKVYSLKKAIEKGNADAMVLCDDIFEIYSAKELIEYTEIDDVDVLLNVKFAKAKELGKIIQYSINIDKDSDIKTIDLCVILGNILDNAIEHSTDEGNIKLKLFSQNGYLIIDCYNSIESKVIDLNKTSKNNSNIDHGYGITNMRKIAEKYNGNIVVEKNKHDIEVSIIMKQYYS